MKYSRREGLRTLMAAAVAGTAEAASVLPSKTYRFQDLPEKANGSNSSRAVLNGETHSGVPIEMHITELAPGGAPHPPHNHQHEEMILIHKGTLEVTISGRSVQLGPGSSAFVASNEEHGWRNVGPDRAMYFVLALGRD